MVLGVCEVWPGRLHKRQRIKVEKGEIHFKKGREIRLPTEPTCCLERNAANHRTMATPAASKSLLQR